MRKKSLLFVLAAAAVSAVPAVPASANLVLSRNEDATISSLSEQLLDHSRSAAGRRKNVWDADPPQAADNGYHYFLYNYGADGHSLPRAQRPLTVSGISAGPGYRITDVQVLVRFLPDGDPDSPSSAAFFLDFGAVAGVPSDTFDNPAKSFGLNPSYEEFGLLRFTFATDSANAYGQIGSAVDSPELAYDGPSTRGIEHARIFTETLAGHDDDVLRGTMTANVASDFVRSNPSFYTPGFLDFGNGDISTGLGVTPASITIPEPATLAALGFAATLLRRRRR